MTFFSAKKLVWALCGILLAGGPMPARAAAIDQNYNLFGFSNPKSPDIPQEYFGAGPGFLDCIGARLGSVLSQVQDVFGDKKDTSELAEACGEEDQSIATLLSGNAPSSIISATCKDFGPPIDKVSCDEIRKTEDLHPAVCQNYHVAESKRCKAVKLHGANAGISCYLQGMSKLMQQASQIGSSLVEELNRIQAIKNDLVAQAMSVRKRLEGDPETGAIGLAKAQDDLVKSMPGIENDYRNAERKFTQIKQANDRLERAKKIRTSALARQCFEQPTDALRCDKNMSSYYDYAHWSGSGRPEMKPSQVNAMDFIVCRVFQNNYTGPNGEIQSGYSSRAFNAAQSMALGVEKAVKTLLGKMPNNPEISLPDPKSPGDLTANDKQPTQLLTMEQVLAAIQKSTLKIYNKKGIDVVENVSKNMIRCFKEASATVTNEVDKEIGALGVFSQGINEAKRDATTEVNNALNQYYQKLQEIRTALTDVSLPYTDLFAFGITGGIDSCLGQLPQVQMDCLGKFRSGFRNLLNGTSSSAYTQIEVVGNDPAHAKVLQCVGLNGCVAGLRAAYKLLNQQKADYVAKASQNVSSYMQQAAAMLGAQSKVFKAQLNEVNGILASLGYDDPIEYDPIKSTPLKTDKDGLQLPPDNPLGAVAALVVPPLEDTNSPKTDASKAIGKAMNKANAEFAEARTAAQKLLASARACRKERLESKSKDLADLLKRAIEKDCEKTLGSDARTDTSLGSALASLEQIFNKDLDISALDSLKTGIRNYKGGEEKRKIEDEIRRARRELAAATTEAEGATFKGKLSDLQDKLERYENSPDCEAIAQELKAKRDEFDRAYKEMDLTGLGR